MSNSKKILLIVLIPIVLVIISFASYSLVYAQKILPNVWIANIEVGGLTRNEAQKKLLYQIDSVKNKDLELSFNNQINTIKPSDLDLIYDPEKSLDAAYAIGRDGLLINQFIQKIESLYINTKLKAAFTINKTKLNRLVDNYSQEINQPVKEASLKIDNGEVLITESQQGKLLEKDQLENQIINIIGNLADARLIDLPLTTVEPQLTSKDVKLAQSQITKILTKPITLKSSAGDYEIDKSRLISWIELVAKPVSIKSVDYELKVLFNEEKIKNYIKELASKINKDPQDAKIIFNGENISVSSNSQNGYNLNQDQALKTIVASLEFSSQVAGISSDQGFDKNLFNIELPVETKIPNITENNIVSLGIKELISTANTNYKGSPENRRSNIKTGAAMFNGVVIKPGEEFSFLKYLGSVSEERGFKKELVIKQDSTEPEVGGGLCQVSTTMFRAALNAGLKITERTNHKYRVSYYEPPVGLDATIYEPAPDLKFVNDTPGHILVQSKIKNDNNITFEFYGTKDGRISTISDPVLYDYVNAPATRYIDDPEMNEGETKYLEKAHTGVKAKVYYQVKRDNEVINEQTFYSNYKAWGAVIKRGTKKVEQPAPTSEPAPAPEPTPNPTPAPEPTPAPTPPAEPAPTI